MGGALEQNPPTPYPDGINDFESSQFLTPAQFKTLNPYNYDPAKAASLLESVGFKKKGGTWYTPKGSPFNFTISEPSANSQFDTDGIVVANQLKAFGINASSVIVNQATYTDQQYAGDYMASENFMDWQIGTPMSDFAATFGSQATAGVQLPGHLGREGHIQRPGHHRLRPDQQRPRARHGQHRPGAQQRDKPGEAEHLGATHVRLGPLVQPEPAVPPDVQQRLPRVLRDLPLHGLPAAVGEMALDQPERRQPAGRLDAKRVLEAEVTTTINH